VGEIKQQGISNTIYMYVGLGVGFLNTLFVQPELLTTSEIGLTKVLFSFSMLFSTLLPMGSNNMILRYYPRFRDEARGDHGFLGLVTGITLLGFVVYGLLLWLFSPLFLSSYLEKSPAFANYFLWVFPFGL
jgi:O-antigen/teichoic acid export membrane protein